MTLMTEPLPRITRHRFRFSLKSLLLVTTLLSVVLAMLAQPLMEARRNQRRLDHAVSLGAEVNVRDTVSRDFSVGRFALAMFSTSYDRHRLYALNFSNAKLSDDELEELTKLEHIQELDLRGTQITDRELLHLQKLKYLRKLNLSGTQVTDLGMKHLSKIETLLSLQVKRTQVTYAALEELDSTLRFAHFCEEKAIEDLKALGVQVVDLPRQVVDLPRLVENIERGRLVWYSQAGKEAHYVIVGMDRKLSLTGEEVALLGYLPSLETIDFHSVTIGPGGFTAMNRLPKLTDLTINSTNITDGDLEWISRQTQIKKLSIYYCNAITDEGLAHLRALTNLRELKIHSCSGISQEAFFKLIQELPDCQSELTGH